jgi:Tol biopolymer transport system component
MSLRLSPDATRAVTAIPGPSGDGQLWVLDLIRGVSTRLASETWTSEDPVWSASGERVMYGSQELGSIDIYTRFADGSGETEPILVDGTDKIVFDWSRDGEYVAYSSTRTSSGTQDILIYSTARGESEPLIVGEATYSGARFSPNGRWIAYVADDTGRREVFIQVFGGDDVKAGARWRLSTAGGEKPHWRNDGREIVYLDPQRRMMAVSIEEREGRLALGTPEELFTIHDMIVASDATGDHQRFLLATRDEVVSEPLHVILDWPADL